MQLSRIAWSIGAVALAAGCASVPDPSEFAEFRDAVAADAAADLIAVADEFACVGSACIDAVASADTAKDALDSAVEVADAEVVQDFGCAQSCDGEVAGDSGQVGEDVDSVGELDGPPADIPDAVIAVDGGDDAEVASDADAANDVEIAVDILLPCVPVDCDDGNVCTSDSCGAGICKNSANTAACDDKNLCTFGDICNNAVCSPGLLTQCNDGDACTTDSCIDEKGCVYITNANGSICAAGDKCTAPSACTKGICTAGKSTNCDDGNSCTDDSCDGLNGCAHLNNDKNVCSDSNLCTDGDICKSGVCASLVKVCKNGDPCKSDSCDAKIGCVATKLLDGSPCNDANACTLQDVCKDGICGGSGGACDDNNACTADSCKPASGCVHDALNGLCNDGNPYTVNENCAGGVCGGGIAILCNDNNLCTSDYCDKSSGCKFSAEKSVDGADCDDGNTCTKKEKCLSGVCGNGKPACDDNIPCTIDTCDLAGLCKFTPTKEQISCYFDGDKDGYGTLLKPSLFCGVCGAGYVANNTDCDDASADVHPNQPGWFAKPRSDGTFDYDCDGKTAKLYNDDTPSFCPAMLNCNSDACVGQGPMTPWTLIPCGTALKIVSACSCVDFCAPVYAARIQICH